MVNFAESGHPVFRATSALERWELKSKGKGKKSIHFNGSDETIDLILRTICFCQPALSIYGAAADLCKELARDSASAGKPAAIVNLWSMVNRQNFQLLTLFLGLMPKYNESCRVNTCKKSQNFLNNRNWRNSAPMLVSRRTLRKTVLHYTWWWCTWRYERIMSREKPYLEVRNHPAWECGFVETRRSAQSWMWKSVCYHQGRYGVEIMIESLFRDRTVRWVRIVNGITKYVTETSEEVRVASVENGCTGNLSRRLNHDQSRLLRWPLCLFLVMNGNG